MGKSDTGQKGGRSLIWLSQGCSETLASDLTHDPSPRSGMSVAMIKDSFDPCSHILSEPKRQPVAGLVQLNDSFHTHNNLLIFDVYDVLTLAPCSSIDRDDAYLVCFMLYFSHS